MNKRKLRNYADPHLTFNRNNGLLYVDHFRYIVRTTVTNVDGHRTLRLFFYPKKDAVEGRFVPQYTVFQTKEAYLTLEQTPEEKTKWRTAMTADLLRCTYESIISKSAFYTKRDEERVSRFCSFETDSGFNALYRLQSAIYNKKCLERRKQKERKIFARMKPVGKIPANVFKWVKSEVIPTHIFYEYRKGRKTQIGYCSHCKKEVEVSDARHAKKGFCPCCKREVTFHALGKTAVVSDRITVQFLQRIGDELILRICKTSINYRDYLRPKVTFWENARAFIPIEGDGDCEPYYFSYSIAGITPWRNGERPVINKWRECFEAETCGFLYPNNLDTVLNVTPWKYSQLHTFAQMDPMEVMPYLRTYLKYPMLEYLVKLRLFRLAADLVYRDGNYVLHTNGRNVQEVLGIPTEYLPLMQELNVDTKTLKLAQELCEKEQFFHKELIAWCQENEIYHADDLIICLRYISEHKLMRYINGQYEALKATVVPFNYRPFCRREQVFSQYKDYIRFCQDLKYDLTDDFILFPKNLKEAHDRAAEMFKEQETKIINSKIVAAYAGLAKQYGMKKFGMMIVAPKTASAIVEEGQKLHHCVGGYVSRVANQECVILFLRKTSEPDKPFYTIELRNGKVAQIRGNQNCDPTPQVEKYMRVWEQAKLLPAAQTVQQAA